MHSILCVAQQEDQAEALSYAVISVPDVIVVGICAPHQVDQLVSVTSATLIIAVEGTVIPDVEELGLPVLTIAANADAAKVLDAYLKTHTATQPPVQQTAPTAEATTATPRLPFAPLPRQLRLGFYGMRGGVGTTTAAVTAAKLLAAQSKSVALFDAAQRGDPYLLLGLTPADQPATTGTITVYPDMLLDDARVSFDAILVDGGRERRVFPARWIAVDKPLSEANVAKLLGIDLASLTQEAPQC